MTAFATACWCLVCLAASSERAAQLDSNAGRLDRCGANALAVCCRSLGLEVSVDELDEALGRKGVNTNLLDLKCAAEARDVEAVALRWTGESPGAWLARAPAIAPVVARNGRSHFVAVVGVRDANLLVVDFPFGPAWVAGDELRRRWQWDGTLLHVTRDSAIAEDLRRLGMAGSGVSIPAAFGAAAVGIILLVSVARRRSTVIRPASPAPHARAGFTVLELLVVMGIIAILVGLLVPAVMSARAAARRAACLNNLHQIGVALEAFESTHRRYPAGGVAARNRAGQEVSKNISPHVGLLPYLDQAALFEKFDRDESGSGIDQDPPVSIVNAELMDHPLSVFQCPDDPAGLPRNNYRISCGTSPSMHETIPANAPGAALQGFRSLLGRFDAEIRDGKSQTTAFAEKLSGDRTPGTYSPWVDLLSLTATPPGGMIFPDDALRACSAPADPNPRHFSFGGATWVLSGYPQTWYNHVLTPNSRIPDCVDGGPSGHGAYTARSYHAGGVNVLFCDGGVRFVSDAIDLGVWRAIGTVKGQETVEF